MLTNTTSNSSYFLNSLLRRILIVQFFLFFFIPANAQTVVAGLEQLIVKNGAVMYIDSTESKSTLDGALLLGEKNQNNSVVNHNGKLTENSLSNKNSKGQTQKNLPEKIQFTYHSKENDSSFSMASKQQIIALSSNSQWNAVGIIEEAKYQYLHLLWNKSKISEKEIFFAEHIISYKSSRAPPFC